MSARSQTRSEAAALLTVERGMQVLRAFRGERYPLGNAEIVRRTRLPKATVSRLTSTLLQIGYLRHVPGNRGFELAAGSLGVGHAFLEASESIRAADPFLQELADRLDGSVALAIGDRLEMLYVAYRVSRKVATLRLGLGSVLPMGTTAIGHAYLWGQPAAERSRLVAELTRTAGPHAGVVENGIRKSFAELESSGTCGVVAGYQRDSYGIAVPVVVGRDRLVMSLSRGKAEVRPDLALAAARKHIAPALKEAAQRLEGLLADLDGQP